MPLVRISRRAEKIIGDTIGKVARALPAIVAKHLGQPNHPVFKLTPEEVEVRLDESPYNVMHFDVEVVITALKSQERIANGKLQTDGIALDLQALLPEGTTGFVWVTLVDGFFSSF